VLIVTVHKVGLPLGCCTSTLCLLQVGGPDKNHVTGRNNEFFYRKHSITYTKSKINIDYNRANIYNSVILFYDIL